MGNPGPGTALPSPIKVPLPTREVTGKKFEQAVDLLREPIGEACGNGQCVTVKRLLDPDFDVTLLTQETCDMVTRAVGAEGVGETQTVSVERGGTMLLNVSPDCSAVPEQPTPPAGGGGESR